MPRLPLRTSQLGELSARVPELMTKVEEVSERVNQLLSDTNQKNFAKTLEGVAASAASINKITQSLDHTLTQRVDPALAALPALVNDSSKTMQALQGAAKDVSRTADAFTATADRLNGKDGPIDRLAEGTGALSQAADTFGSTTLPRLNRVGEETSRAARQLSRTVTNINDNPQSLIFGNGVVHPGPGEPGFVSPSVGTTGARP